MPQKSVQAVTFTPRAVNMQEIDIQKDLDIDFQFINIKLPISGFRQILGHKDPKQTTKTFPLQKNPKTKKQTQRKPTKQSQKSKQNKPPHTQKSKTKHQTPKSKKQKAPRIQTKPQLL